MNEKHETIPHKARVSVKSVANLQLTIKRGEIGA
jgi:hypothetical protein